jgi:hypothetical protein
MSPLSGEEKGAGFWVGKTKGKRIFGRSSHRRKVHVKIFNIWREVEVGMSPSQDAGKWRKL